MAATLASRHGYQEAGDGLGSNPWPEAVAVLLSPLSECPSINERVIRTENVIVRYGMYYRNKNSAISPAQVRDEAIKASARKTSQYILDAFDGDGQRALAYLREVLADECIDEAIRLFIREIKRQLSDPSGEQSSGSTHFRLSSESLN